MLIRGGFSIFEFNILKVFKNYMSLKLLHHFKRLSTPSKCTFFAEVFTSKSSMPNNNIKR